MDSQRVPLTPSAHNGGWRSVCAQERSGCNMRGQRRVGAWAPPSPGAPGPTKPHSPGQTLMAERSKGGGAHAEHPLESGTKCPQGQRDVPSQGSKLTPAPLPWRALEEPHPRGHIRQPLPTRWPYISVSEGPCRQQAEPTHPSCRMAGGGHLVNTQVTATTVTVTAEGQNHPCSSPAEPCATLTPGSPTSLST